MNAGNNEEMDKSVKVLVKWSPEKMAHLPSSCTYSTVAKFEEDAAHWPEKGWSVVLEFPAPPDVSHAESYKASARFLVPNAPWERLKTGCVFDLYEGFKRTANITVL